MWGGRSLPEVSHAMLTLRSEVEDAKEKGRSLRQVKLVTVQDGNHFVRAVGCCASGALTLISSQVHWDHPEHAMRALLGEDEVI